MSFGVPVRNGVGIGLLASTSLSTRNRTGFNPATVLFGAGEQGGWYDPSDISTLFQDTAGTTPVTATGQTVARINDKSGRGNHLTQATAESRPQYQIDGSGFPYLLFDGTDDWFISPTITPGIGKAQVFAGVRKLSDAAAGEVVGSSTSPGGLAGTFFLRAPNSAGPNYQYRSRGTTANGVIYANAAVAAPVTNVLTGLSDISGPSEALRVNGTVVGSNTLTQGTGNYLAYPLYVGRTGGTTNPFNGRMYQMIVRFGANLDAATIAATEAFVNSKTGAYV